MTSTRRERIPESVDLFKTCGDIPPRRQSGSVSAFTTSNASPRPPTTFRPFTVGLKGTPNCAMVASCSQFAASPIYGWPRLESARHSTTAFSCCVRLNRWIKTGGPRRRRRLTQPSFQSPASCARHRHHSIRCHSANPIPRASCASRDRPAQSGSGEGWTGSTCLILTRNAALQGVAPAQLCAVRALMGFASCLL